MAKLTAECGHGLCHTVVTDGVNGRVARDEYEDGSVDLDATCSECYEDEHRDDPALVAAEDGSAWERYLDDRHHRLYDE